MKYYSQKNCISFEKDIGHSPCGLFVNTELLNNSLHRQSVDRYYLALRDNSEMSGATPSSPSALAGLPSYWDTAGSPPKIEWEKWWGIFTVAVNAKHSITITELLMTPTEAQLRQPALINNLNEQAAERKVVSILFLLLGTAGRKKI